MFVSIQLSDLIKRQISVFQFRVKISCLTSLPVCSTNALSTVYICSPCSNKLKELCLIVASKLEIKNKLLMIITFLWFDVLMRVEAN